MKVCLVSLNALPALSRQYQHVHAGGAEVQLALLAMDLAKLGHETSMVVGDFGQPDGEVFGGVRTFKAFKPTAGLPGLRFIHPRWTGLWGAVSRAGADVYYYSCAGMMLGLLAMYCSLHRRRLVFRAASDSDCSRQTLLAKYQRDRWLYEFGLRRTDAVLVQSATQQAAMLANYGASSTIVRGLIERPLEASSTVRKDIDVLWVANMRQLKRPDRFIEVAKALPQYRFHMAGGSLPGEEGLFQLVQAQARDVGNLTIHGRVPYLEIGRLFDRARLVANTSEVEGFPNTFLQAWVRGIPVATLFDPDRIVARESLGTSHDSVSDMVCGLTAMLGSAELYAKLSHNTTAFMEKNFGSEKVLGPYLDALTGARSQISPCRA